MQLWERTNDKIKCLACARHCQLAKGNVGFCKVRINENGKLKSLVYGKPAAINIDPIEKKPLFHFLPGSNCLSIGTVGCNLQCAFCQNWEISQTSTVRPEKEITSDEIIKMAKRANVPSIALTYNEPTVFIEYAIDVCKAAKAADIKTVFVTNGYESKNVWDALNGLLDGANIDLKGSDAFYKKLCKARLQPVLDSIKKAHELGIWIEITTLIIPGENDTEKELKDITEFISRIDMEIPWHITAFHPDYKMLDKQPTPLSSLLHAREIGLNAGLRHIYVGNVNSEFENTVCPSCGKTAIKRKGFAVLENNLEKGKCKCGQTIKGICV